MIAEFGVAGTDTITAAWNTCSTKQDEIHKAPVQLTLFVISAALPVSAPTSSPTPVALSAGKIIPARETELVGELKNLPPNKTSPKAFLQGVMRHQD